MVVHIVSFIKNGEPMFRVFDNYKDAMNCKVEFEKTHAKVWIDKCKVKSSPTSQGRKPPPLSEA